MENEEKDGRREGEGLHPEAKKSKRRRPSVAKLSNNSHYDGKQQLQQPFEHSTVECSKGCCSTQYS